MTVNEKTPIHREEDKEFLGFVARDAAGWQAQTIFGYTISRTTSRKDAETLLQERGLSFLMGVWQYYDKDDQDWHACVIKEANEHYVTVVRTNPMGYQDPDDYKRVTLKDPNENTLIKSH